MFALRAFFMVIGFASLGAVLGFIITLGMFLDPPNHVLIAIALSGFITGTILGGMWIVLGGRK